MKNQTIQLNIGDEIGFVFMAQNTDEKDKTVFFKVVEITERDGERAYRYQFPDGEISRSAIRQSDLADHAVKIQPKAEPDMLCLSMRKDEFIDALNRGESSNLQVFNDWEFNSFVVKNRTNCTEYRVNLDTANGKVFGECTCPDYEYRKRVCKHISAVLADALFGMSVN